MWITGRGSDRQGCWHRQGSAERDRCNAVLLGCSTGIRYIIIYLTIHILFALNIFFYVTICFCLFLDVLSSLSSMSSLTPEQSANATPDASLQPSSINSAQRYLYDLHLLYIFIFKAIFIYFCPGIKQRRTKEESGAHNRFCGTYKHSSKRTSCLQQANSDHSDNAYIPRR